VLAVTEPERAATTDAIPAMPAVLLCAQTSAVSAVAVTLSPAADRL